MVRTIAGLALVSLCLAACATQNALLADATDQAGNDAVLATQIQPPANTTPNLTGLNSNPADPNGTGVGALWM